MTLALLLLYTAVIVGTVYFFCNWHFIRKCQLKTWIALSEMSAEYEKDRRSQTFTDVKKTLLQVIENQLFFSDIGRRVFLGTEQDQALVRWAFKRGYLSVAEITKAVHRGLLRLGRVMYDQEDVKAQYAPDHTSSPCTFAYALLRGAISREEAEAIRFGHNETLKGFVKRADNLLETVMEQLSHPPAQESSVQLGFAGVHGFCPACD